MSSNDVLSICSLCSEKKWCMWMHESGSVTAVQTAFQIFPDSWKRNLICNVCRAEFVNFWVLNEGSSHAIKEQK